MFFMQLEINTPEEKSTILATDKFEYSQTQEEEEFRQEFYQDFDGIQTLNCVFFLLCDRLERSKIVKFRIEGFGKEPWPVDVRTDFDTVIEQCCDFLEFLEIPSSKTGEIYLYEQGVERRLIFAKLRDLVQVQCKPVKFEYRGVTKTVGESQSWGQDVEEAPIDLSHLKTMIRQLVKTFVFLAKELDPDLANHEYFQQWYGNQYIANCL